jgi:hypothetical protein
MKWGDAARPAGLTLLTVLIFTVSFRDAFPLETMTRAEKERACWDLLTALATQVEPKKQLRAAMDSPYARVVCATIDLKAARSHSD